MALLKRVCHWGQTLRLHPWEFTASCLGLRYALSAVPAMSMSSAATSSCCDRLLVLGKHKPNKPSLLRCLGHSIYHSSRKVTDL